MTEGNVETTKQQISRLIDKSNNILVAIPENINGDALGGALALAGALKKLGKNAQLITPEKLPTKFGFLPKTNSLSYNTFQEREFVLSIKNPEDHINNLYFEKNNGLLHIYLNTKKKIEEQDFRLLSSHPFDLIFAVNSQDFENLGRAFEYNPELFYETPLINIDNHTANENFGEINLVDITSSSVSEIIMEFIDFLDRNLLDKDIATWILTGLIDATDNLQSPRTTPRTFNNAALLINRGGDQQQVIQYFYKTKSLGFLKLWGRILHELSWDKEKKLIQGRIRQNDFQKTNTTSEHIPQIFEEIKTAFPEMKTALLLWPASSPASPNRGESQDWLFSKKIEGAIYSLDSELLKGLAPRLSGVFKNGNLLFSTPSEPTSTPASLNRGERDEQNLATDWETEGKALNKAKKQVLDLIDKEL